MSALTRIQSRLENYPDLSYDLDDNHLAVNPQEEDGFTVWITENDSGYTVGFDGWHDEFDDEDDALEYFAFGLSDECRLKVVTRGGKDCSWVVERRSDDLWEQGSMTGLIFVPIWRRKKVEYRRNYIIVSEQDRMRR